jgi:D-alanine-D-alanine ligase
MSLLTTLSALRRARFPNDFGKVAVLLGGDSSEREISLLSGNAVLAALKRRGVDAHPFDPRETPVQNLVSEKFDRAWIALHGPGGEDGVMQGALEWLGIPYTGSGVLASALTMDKLKTKRVVVGAGYAAPEYAVLSSAADLQPAIHAVGLPMMVKPASQGSSVGITKVKTSAELKPAFEAARSVDPVVFAERFIAGGEFTVSVLNDRALPSIRIEPANEFYDYEAKYLVEGSVPVIPAKLTKSESRRIREMAVAAFRACDLSGLARVDFLMEPTGKRRIFLNEVNTMPGFTRISMYPKLWEATGVSYKDLITRLIELALERQAEKSRTVYSRE